MSDLPKIDPHKYPHPYFEGHYAREFGADRTDNPYAEGTAEHWAWDQGWEAIDEASEAEPEQ